MANKNKFDPSELQKIWDELNKERGRLLLGKFSNIPTPPPARVPNPWSTSTAGLSPTDVAAQGKFEYQAPEQDEQGTYYGYKVLWTGEDAKNCACEACQAFRSPRFRGIWINGELHADATPRENTMCGIHFTKSPYHPALRDYWLDNSSYPRNMDDRKSFLVKCALSGTIVETEQGFRAEHAQIIGVYINGNWQSYQDYQERPRPNSRQNSQVTYTWEEEWKSHYAVRPPKGIWNATYTPPTDS